MKHPPLARTSPWLNIALFVALFAGLPPALAQTAASPVSHGSVGVGTYDTVAQFKDLRVTVNDQVVLAKTLAEGLADFDVSGGQWKVLDNVLQQSSTEAKGIHILNGGNATDRLL